MRGRLVAMRRVQAVEVRIGKRLSCLPACGLQRFYPSYLLRRTYFLPMVVPMQHVSFMPFQPADGIALSELGVFILLFGRLVAFALRP
ncbi:hypothetical protein GGR50DRAFT_678172 [Xylaria sp. CBS 124048]|nr:hypothetical protein GGR50DRAFT_678172 [Xylaria sp. CBS 124048]